MSPMILQYLEIKEKYREYILMYRVGDFYEMFFDDAKTVSSELDLVLTGKDYGEDERAPMCGVPFHAVENYIGRLVAKGYKVAVCDQTEDPATAKGLVKREVTRMITPGTVTETAFLDEKKNNYICAVCVDGGRVGVCFADISTGYLSATEFDGEGAFSHLLGELSSHSPSEAVLNSTLSAMGEAGEYLRTKTTCFINEEQAYRFDGAAALREAKARLSSVPAEFESESDAALRAFGAVISYSVEMQKNDLSNISEINFYKNGEYLEIDANTRRSLELSESMRRGDKKGTLLWVLDKTKTAAGARMLKSFIDFPLVSPPAITRRLEAVDELYRGISLRGELGEAFSGVLDMERLITRIVYGTANPRDLLAVAQTTEKIPMIKAIASGCVSRELKNIADEIDALDDIGGLIRSSIDEEAPITVREGKIIKSGYSSDVDYLRSIMNNSKEWIEKIEDTERLATGIRTLKVGFNRVFGYYIEVSKSFISDVPERYIRKQTLTNCERYITEELKDMEAQVLGASDKLNTLEYQLFTEIREEISKNVHRIQKTASQLAKLDVYRSLAEAAAQNGYVRPEVTYGDAVSITDGRHPVVEQFSKNTYFIPNDTELDCKSNRFMLITGPNMAGKSTYMRQVALICIMAQIGSFVPAREARISVTDKIFTRVGASDDLAMGQSTFMTEMSEVAYILSNATRQSLIIYDEIGRGTSTFDGMSIARAVAEYTASKKLGAKTLFATHYHELTSLEGEIDGVVNYNIAAKKKGDTITFLRKIIRGAADDSYGIEVAKLAGVPSEVTRRAKDVLSSLESGTFAPKVKRAREQIADDDAITFENFEEKEVCRRLREIDINTLTPLEAMNTVYEMKKMLV